MLRFAVARRWWLGHLLVVICCLVFVRLGRWQWDRASSPTGSWQNLGYALQWPLFAVVLVAAWVRFLWLEQHHVAEPDVAGPDPGVDLYPPEPAQPPALPRHFDQQPDRPVHREDDPDDELVAYNAYLAQLAQQDRR